MNYVAAILCLIWISFALTDKKRSLMFALLSLSDAVLFCQNLMPIWLFGVLMAILGGGICGAAYYYYIRKFDDTFGSVMYALIGVMVLGMGIMAF